MAITIDTTSVSANVSDTSVTWQHICGADTTILVVAVQVLDTTFGDRPVQSVTHNGKDLVLAVKNDYEGADLNVEIWYRISPDIGGTPNIVVTMAGKCSDLIANAISLKGTAIVDPIDDTGDGATIGSPITGRMIGDDDLVTGTDNCFIVDSMVEQQADPDQVSADFNELHETDFGTAIAGSQYREAGDAGEYNMSWTDIDADEKYTIVAIAIKEAVAAGPSNVKSVNGVAIVSVKSVNTVAKADIKSINTIT